MSEIFSVFISSFIIMVAIIIYGRILTKNGKMDSHFFVKATLLLIISSLIHMVIYIFLGGEIKTIMLALLYTITIMLLFNMDFEKSLLSSIIYIIIVVIPDLITLGIAIYVFGLTKEQCYETVAGGIISNFSVSLLMIFIVYILRKPLRKIVNINISSDKKIIITSIITIIFVAIFFYKFAIEYRLDQNVIVYLIAMLAFSAVLFSLLKQKLDNNKIAKNYDNLLDIMKNYESDIENQRTFIHETKNELSTIRSKIKDKESEKHIMEYIDSIIGDKVSSDMSKYSKFKYLPSNGLKGFFYYKFTEAERKGINVSINISKNIENSFLGKLDTKNFKDLARIIGVYLDNAIEASSQSESKKLGIEIYFIKENIDIIISNTFDNKINKEKIGNEKFSTKGKNRGHGLLLVKKILTENKMITSENEINGNLYIQKIRVENSQ